MARRKKSLKGVKYKEMVRQDSEKPGKLASEIGTLRQINGSF